MNENNKLQLAFPAKTTGQQSERRMTLSGVVLLVLSLRAPGAKKKKKKKKKKRHLTIVSAAVILLRFFKWKTVFSLYVFDTNIETRLLFSSSSDVSPALRARLHSAAVRQLSARHTPNGNLFGRFSSGPDLPPEAPVETTYHLALEGTIRGKTKLVTNTGYAFNIRKRRPNGTID